MMRFLPLHNMCKMESNVGLPMISNYLKINKFYILHTLYLYTDKYGLSNETFAYFAYNRCKYAELADIRGMFVHFFIEYVMTQRREN
jgi:hypothetical protein